MKLNFCTLFNSNYLSRGLVLYESLLLNCTDFHLYVFAFDDECYKFLKQQNYAHLTVISLKEFEDDKLLNIKPTRSVAEYCWTCTPSTILYAISNYHLDNCTYIDADMLFMSDPHVLIDEMGTDSVLITEHRYTKEYDQSDLSGKYCVQFVTIKANEAGLKVCQWWREACLDWCYAKHEDGKFGDQKYLDDWTTRFKGVHELKHLGGGIAPWNVQQYKFEFTKGELVGTEKKSGKKFTPVFFHFHSLKFYDNDIVSLSDEGYLLNSDCINYFYKPYVRLLHNMKNRLYSMAVDFNPHGSSGKSEYLPLSLQTFIHYYRRDLKASKRNLFGQKLLHRLKHHYFFYTDKI